MKRMRRWGRWIGLGALLLALAGLGPVRAEAVSLAETFPDEALRALMAFVDNDSDGNLSDGEILGKTWLNISEQAGVKSLAGIEKLTSLEHIELRLPALTDPKKLDLTVYPQLTYLDIVDTPVEELTIDSGSCPNLGYVELWETKVKSLDLSGKSGLRELVINNTPLASLDISGDSSLESLYISSPDLVSLKTDGCSNLAKLTVESSKLETLDLSSLYALQELSLENCTALKTLKLDETASLYGLELNNCNALQEVDLGSGIVIKALVIIKSSSFPGPLKGGKKYIQKLYIDDVPLPASLDLKEYENLESLTLYSVPGIASLDVSSNILTSLFVRDDSMTDLTLKLNSSWYPRTEHLAVVGSSLQTLTLEGARNLPGGYNDSGNWIGGLIDYCTALKKLTLKGDAPDFDDNVFAKQDGLAVYYPYGNATWTKGLLKDYGGKNITWHAYDPATGKEVSGNEPETTKAEEKETTGKKAGDTIKDKASNGIYKVNKGAKTVTLTGVIKKSKKLTIPKKIKSGKQSFSVTAIAKKACKGNTKLTAVDIPSTVTSIGAEAFSGCKKLMSIRVRTTKLTAKKVGKNAFKKVPAKVVVQVPKKQTASYKSIFTAKGLTKKAVWK